MVSPLAWLQAPSRVTGKGLGRRPFLRPLTMEMSSGPGLHQSLLLCLCTWQFIFLEKIPTHTHTHTQKPAHLLVLPSCPIPGWVTTCPSLSLQISAPIWVLQNTCYCHGDTSAPSSGFHGGRLIPLGGGRTALAPPHHSLGRSSCGVQEAQPACGPWDGSPWPALP